MLVPSLSQSQDASHTGHTTRREDVRHVRGDIWHVITSPVRADRRALAPAFALAGAIAVVAPYDSVVFAWMQAHPDAPLMRAIAPVRENYRVPFYELGSAFYLIPISVALYTGGRLADEHNVRDAGLGCFASEVASSALRVFIQLNVNRQRPRESPDPGHIAPSWTRRYKGFSFPSGHVANPAACASFAANRFELGAAEPVMFVYVGAIALARIADAQHWGSDVVAGAGMGYAIGKAIADRQHQRRRNMGIASPSRGPIVHVPLLSIGFR